jgi:hypothetical protein
MTDNVYTPDLFRPHYGGGSDNDIHIEAYDRDVQTRLRQIRISGRGAAHTGR